MELLSGRSATLKSFQEGMVSLIQGTPSRAKGNSRPTRPTKTAEQTAADKMVEEASTPLGSVYAARRVMKLKRAADNQFQKIVRDWEALYGQRKDKLTQKYRDRGTTTTFSAPMHRKRPVNASVVTMRTFSTAGDGTKKIINSGSTRQ